MFAKTSEKKFTYYFCLWLALFLGLFVSLSWVRVDWQEMRINQSNLPSATALAKGVVALPEAQDKPALVQGPVKGSLAIPALGLKATVIFPDTNDTQYLVNSLKKAVVQLPQSGRPDNSQTVMLLGHSWSQEIKSNPYYNIFTNNYQLKPGDKIVLNYLNKDFIYKVVGQKVIAPAEISHYFASPEADLILTTCWPLGTSWKRLLILAKQE